MAPKISVLLPAYNHEKYIQACVDSLLHQSEPDIEILAVDDGSTDQTGRILDRMARADRRLCVFHKENGGVVSALNTALAHAGGEWIASCGSDDAVPRGAYRTMLRRGAAADVVIGEFSQIDDAGRRMRVRLSDRFGSDCFSALFAMPATWNKLIRREFVVRAGLKFPDVVLCEDLIFLARLATLSPRYALVKKDIYHYRNIPGTPLEQSMTHTYTADYFKAHIAGRQTVAGICMAAGMPQGLRYVYQDSLPFLAGLFQRMPEQEREKSFEVLRQFLSEGRRHLDEERFRRVFLLSPDDLLSHTGEEYARYLLRIPHEEFVIQKLRAGELGLQFALQCAKAWCIYRLERKKEKK